MGDIAIAAVLAATILVASTVSIELGLSVALIELLAGFAVGNAFSIDVPGWLNFIGTFAGVVLTFLAGAEVDVPQFRREWRASVSIGLVSFFAPFVVVGLLAYYGLGWNHRQAEIAGIALSTTSLAVVYAVLVETGLNKAVIGKRIMAATFVTDLGTAAALSILFIKPSLWIVPFVGASIALVIGGSQADRRLPARPPLLLTSCDVHDVAHEHGPDVRHDQLSLRVERTHHRQDSVLPARRRGGAVGNRADSDRAALLPARPGRAARPHGAGSARACPGARRCLGRG